MVWKKVASWVLCALLVVVAVSFADNNVTNMGSYYQNATNGSKVDASGNAYVTESSKDRDRVIKYDSVISDTMSVGTVDSTAIAFDTHDVARGFLFIKAILPAGVATPFVRLAVRVQGHTAATIDSSNTFNFAIRSANFAANADSLAFGSGTAPTTVAAASTEYIVTITHDPISPVSRRRTIIIPLRDSAGSWLWAEYTSVMVRVLSASGNTPTITVSYRGVSN